MKRQVTTSGISKTRKEVKLADHARIARRAHVGQPAHSQAAGKRRPSLALAPESSWTHTLALAGTLDLRSARTLEVEIERLCEEGVTRIVLDLRELARIDAIGVAVIAFRCGHCIRHGHEFALVAGAPSVQIAFEEAGVLDSLPFIEASASGSEAQLDGAALESSAAQDAAELAQAAGELGAGMGRGEALRTPRQSV
jgi:anti-anti-sigma factor